MAYAKVEVPEEAVAFLRALLGKNPPDWQVDMLAEYVVGKVDAAILEFLDGQAEANKALIQRLKANRVYYGLQGPSNASRA